LTTITKYGIINIYNKLTKNLWENVQHMVPMKVAMVALNAVPAPVKKVKNKNKNKNPPIKWIFALNKLFI